MLDKPLYAMQILETRIKRFLNLAKSKNKENLIDKEFLKLLDKPGNITLEKVSPYTIKLREDFQGEELSFALDTMLQAIMVAEEIKKGIKFSVLNAKHHEKEAEIIRQAGKLSAITIATNMAGRGTDIILGGYKSNDHESPDFNIVNLEAQEKVKKLGGLYVIGTERHESRRIDNQLRGRCARQGDLGSSRFFLSLEDNLMRIFGGEKMIGIMNMMKADDDMPIEAGIITEAINNSQKKVESYNFDVRKHVLQYDDVVNTQREVVYRERKKILEGADIHENILKMIKLHIENDLYQYINPKLPTELWFDNSNGELSSMDKLTEQLKNDLGEQILENIKIKDLAEQGFDTLEAGLQETALKAYNEKENIIGLDNLKEAERQIMLHVIDSKWVMHLQAMDSLKEGIHLQGYGQKDPLIEYKKESFDMFEDLLLDIKKNTVSLLFHSRIVEKDQHEHEHETAA
jgi:preprotein translocase subunit SecA